jgi:mono/diheme cytochrome c family protein
MATLESYTTRLLRRRARLYSLIFMAVKAFVLLWFSFAVVRAQTPNPVERGKYLVEHVAMCIQCHTPRNEDGELIRSKLLKGAVIPLKSPFPNKPWAIRAPDIAGLAGAWSETEIVTFLETGARPDGTHPQQPMPPFRLSRTDAAAIAAFLRSLL